MNLDDLTIGQAKELAALFAKTAMQPTYSAQIASLGTHDAIPVIVCTDKRGVVFGYTQNVELRPITLTDARMCLYWSADVGGVFGLAETGPTTGCKISAIVPSISLEGVTAIMSVDAKAEKAWKAAKVQGR
jgi:hypothetical protein